MSYENLELTIRDGVAHLTLNRPRSGNSFDLAMGRELMDAVIRCDEDPAVRSVLFCGAGSRFFSAGGDLKAFASSGDQLPRLLKELTTYLHSATARFLRMDSPVVVAVNGTAAGVGLSLALAGDLVVAAESARFTVAYTGVALAPDGGSTWLLPRLVGFRRAQELILTNRVLSAREALEWNLVTRVVPDAELAESALALAQELAAGPKQAHGRAKRLLASSTSEGLETQMELESRAIAGAGGGAEAREGIAAFLEKRRPDYRGVV